jgi:hypothetical protein
MAEMVGQANNPCLSWLWVTCAVPSEWCGELKIDRVLHTHKRVLGCVTRRRHPKVIGERLLNSREAAVEACIEEINNGLDRR